MPINIIPLNSSYIDEMMLLQEKAQNNKDPFSTSTREFYERAFMYKNFAFGLIDDENNKLVGYCNCSIPTDQSPKNLGRGILPDSELNAVGHVCTILIDAKYRRQGFGAQLLNKAIQTFIEKSDIHYILSTLWVTNIPSYKLFVKCGFHEHSKREMDGINKYLLLRLI